MLVCPAPSTADLDRRAGVGGRYPDSIAERGVSEFLPKRTDDRSMPGRARRSWRREHRSDGTMSSSGDPSGESASVVIAGPAPGWRTIAWTVGPGLIVMLADTDAGNVVTAAQAGAEWGYRLLPLVIALIPMLYLVQ